jgi:hypothetical protein
MPSCRAVIFLWAAYSYSSHAAWESRRRRRRDRSDKLKSLNLLVFPGLGLRRVCRALAGACRNCPGTAEIYGINSYPCRITWLLEDYLLYFLAYMLNANDT